MAKKRIIFKLSAPYSQKQNKVFERIGYTIMDMIYTTILDGNIDDDLWLEVILAINQVKNVRPTKALKSNNPLKAHFKKSANINYLQVLGSTVYVFIHEEEQTLKSEKFEA